jgi:hypothetical protein
VEFSHADEISRKQLTHLSWSSRIEGSRFEQQALAGISRTNHLSFLWKSRGPMRSKPSFCVVSVIAGMLLTGCGRETYERRLDDSKRYFAYLDKMNQNLSPIWAGRGVSLRVPKQFEVIPAPKPKPKKGPAKGGAKAAPEAPEEQRDPRQPTYADLNLPGLQMAFSTKLSTAGKGREMGYLYVLTNGELLGKKGSDEKAAQFNNTVLHTIAQAVGQPDPAPDKLGSNSVPKGEPWVAKRTFKMVRPGFPASIDGKDYRIAVYNCKDQKNEVSLVYVLPENVSPAEKLGTNIDLSLETLQIAKGAPVVGGPEAKAAAGRGL